MYVLISLILFLGNLAIGDASTVAPAPVEATSIDEEDADCDLLDRVSGQYSYTQQFLKMLATLAAFVALLLAIAWIYRKLGLRRALFGNAYSTIQILERRPLSQKTALYLIEIDGQRLLIGDSPAGVHCLSRLEPQKEVAFEAIMKQEVHP